MGSEMCIRDRVRKYLEQREYGVPHDHKCVTVLPTQTGKEVKTGVISSTTTFRKFPRPSRNVPVMRSLPD